MDPTDEIIALLERIEQNQRQALQAQEKHIALTQAQIDRSSQGIRESLDLQRVAVARQAQVRNIALPLIVILLVLMGYLLVRWQVL